MKRCEIKGWRERAGVATDFRLFCATAVEQAMLDEIAELRARLGLDDQQQERIKDPRQLDILEVIRADQDDPAKP